MDGNRRRRQRAANGEGLTGQKSRQPGFNGRQQGRDVEDGCHSFLILGQGEHVTKAGWVD